MPGGLAQPNSAFLGDDGSPDEELRAVLADWRDGGTDGYLAGVVALGGARLLLPIVATGDDGGDGPDPDRVAELAAVCIEGPDGRRALLGFTGLDSLQAWDARARPVPCTLDDLCATVSEAGASALVLDVAGPTPFVIESDLVAELGAGRRLVKTDDGGYAWVHVARD